MLPQSKISDPLIPQKIQIGFDFLLFLRLSFECTPACL